MNPADLPCARELFAQWQRARGGRAEPASRPFSRAWEELLEDARLISATERSEAERDAKALETGGWIELKPVRYKPHLIARVVIPLSMESRWGQAFGFTPPSEADLRRILDHPWEPELAFLRETKLNLPFSELQQINEFFKTRDAKSEIIPIKERSLRIFGDEKRLDALLASALFRPGRLDLTRQFHCEIIGVPLAWKRGPASAHDQPVLVLENAATWHSYSRWNAARAAFSAVVYGDGNRFMDGVGYLRDLFSELGGARPVLYFGDLDAQGLVIPQQASTRAQALGLPPVAPHLWSYRQLLALAAERGQPYEAEPASADLCRWLGSCAEPARRLFDSRQRLPQEWLGWDFLREVERMAD